MKQLTEDENIRLSISATTRAPRGTEQDGVEYHFLTLPEMEELSSQGKIVERRCYQSVLGPWYYMTVDDGQINLDEKPSLLIVTPEAYEQLRS